MVISFGLLAAVMGTIALVKSICLWLAGLWLLPIASGSVGLLGSFTSCHHHL